MNYFTVEEFAKKLKMHPTTVRREIRLGRIYAFRPGSSKKAPYRIAESELERLCLLGMCENKNQENYGVSKI